MACNINCKTDTILSGQVTTTLIGIKTESRRGGEFANSTVRGYLSSSLLRCTLVDDGRGDGSAQKCECHGAATPGTADRSRMWCRAHAGNERMQQVASRPIIRHSPAWTGLSFLLPSLSTPRLVNEPGHACVDMNVGHRHGNFSFLTNFSSTMVHRGTWHDQRACFAPSPMHSRSKQTATFPLCIVGCHTLCIVEYHYHEVSIHVTCSAGKDPRTYLRSQPNLSPSPNPSPYQECYQDCLDPQFVSKYRPACVIFTNEIDVYMKCDC